MENLFESLNVIRIKTKSSVKYLIIKKNKLVYHFSNTNKIFSVNIGYCKIELNW